MKAKDYAARYNAAADKHEEMALILADFFLEVGEMAKKRNATVPAAVMAIFRELNQKFKALCELCPDFHPDYFLRAVQAVNTDSDPKILEMIIKGDIRGVIIPPRPPRR